MTAANPYKKHKPGDRVLTHVISWTIGRAKNEKKTPYVRVKLEGNISWTGWITDKAKQNTKQALDVMGFKGSTMGMLSVENALDTTREIIAVIEGSRLHEGKTYYDARFINRAPNLGFQPQKGEEDLLEDLSKIRTGDVIEGATDITSPAACDKSLAPDGFGLNLDEPPF